VVREVHYYNTRKNLHGVLKNSNNEEDPFIVLIRKLRKYIRKILKEDFDSETLKKDVSLLHELNIISDALVFTVLKTTKSFDTKTIMSHDVFSKILSKKYCSAFLNILSVSFLIL